MNLNKDEIIRFFYENRDSIELGFNLAKGLKEFSVNKSYFSLIESGFSFIKSSFIARNSYILDSISERNGWFKLAQKNEIFPTLMFLPILEKFKNEPIKAEYERNSICRIYYLPMTQLIYYRDQYDKRNGSIFYKKINNISSKSIIDFLIERKIDDLDFTFFSLSFNKDSDNLTQFNFKYENLRYLKSSKADELVTRLIKAKDYNICRSILFYGPPGTGKTTIIHNIVKSLNYKTLIINFDEMTDFNLLLFIIKNFNIEAMIIDDFDLTDKSVDILKFLEDARSKLKIILGSANSLSVIYPPLMRPGRFDEIVKVDHLDKETILSVLGDLDNIFEKVSHWPIAFITELVLRNKLDPSSLDKDILELDERCFKQLEMK